MNRRFTQLNCGLILPVRAVATAFLGQLCCDGSSRSGLPLAAPSALELFEVGLVLEQGDTLAELLHFLLLGQRVDAL